MPSFAAQRRPRRGRWTKKVYIISKIIVGKRAPRYQVKGRNETFMRSELQKVRKVTKNDPRVKTQKLKKLRAEKFKATLPPPVRAAKYLGKEIIVIEDGKVLNDNPATVIEIYKNFLIIGKIFSDCTLILPVVISICVMCSIKSFDPPLSISMPSHYI